MDLRELQKTGRIGRIDVNIRSEDGKSEGEIIIPSALDSSETAIIAAAIETIDRIGPCTAEIEIKTIEDVRATKREYVISRAKAILESMFQKEEADVKKVSEEIKEAVRTSEITNWHGLPAGPDVDEADEIILVEGRADVINLLKNGIRNVVAIEGITIPQTVLDILKGKTVVLFVDGDRGGYLIFKTLSQKTEIDFVAQAPIGKEVEELTKKEIFKALRERMMVEEFKEKIAKLKWNEKHEKKQYRYKINLKPKQAEYFKKILDELVGTRAACIFNESGQLLGRVPVSELVKTLATVEKPHTIVLDGKIDFKLGIAAKQAGVKFIIGTEKEEFKAPLTMIARKDLGI
jgi:DNA primase